jgi:deoxyribodipyrimidine photolyase-related protein
MKSPPRKSAAHRKSLKVRHLVLVLGDQLDADSAAFEGFDPALDRIWMAEAVEEASHVWCNKMRLVFFFSAMRHFRDSLLGRGWGVEYRELTATPEKGTPESLGALLAEDLARLNPREVRVVQPGDERVQRQLIAAAASAGWPLKIIEDRHFFVPLHEAQEMAISGRGYLLEGFYRRMRRKLDVLMDEEGHPLGGQWNFDAQNREAFPSTGPGEIKPRTALRPDELTREVMAMVEARFAAHPGTLEHWDVPVDRKGALKWLEEFIRDHLPTFGRWQDAMWTGQPFLHHARLSALLNVKLISPKEVVSAALVAHRRGKAAIADVEGFVRQILGWREYVRAIYWKEMPGYAQKNYFEATADVPKFFWDGNTNMECVRDAMESVIRHGYAHHIQRLMVLGLYAQLSGVHPYKFHEWHMAMYLDAVDWVSLPNTLGMSQYGDGGIMATKPYCATGNYISRMSNACKQCRFDPTKGTGPRACPFTSMYWNFLVRNKSKFARNARMAFQLKNLERKSAGEIIALRKAAEEHLASVH